MISMADATATASSSSSAAVSPKKYDVFISFRGEDTRTNFTSHLHDALCRNKVETYIDYRLSKGDEVWPSLVKAIEDSTLFLVVFSKNYASSSWCLNELTKILECTKLDRGHLVIPVFYEINPSHVRKQIGTYKIAFAKHRHTNHNQQVHKWRAALTHVANLVGWDSSAYGNEADLIRVIVKGVLIKLNSMCQSVYSDDFIGIHEQIAHLESLLCNNQSQDVRFIGIWGMGGIGKTTIAGVLFNKLCFAFESFCFLANIREESDKYGITYLKNKLLSTLLEDEEPNVGFPKGGSIYVWKRLSRKRVFVVLDDVNDPTQLKELAGALHWFGQGSRVIITTRDKQVLGKNVDDIYAVRALGFGHALQLLKLNAFKNNCSDKEFEQLSWEVVDYSQGIPLALIVLGSFLYGKDKKEWKSQLKKLKKMPHTKIQQTLKLSYDGLDREEKNIFLDVACFFEGRAIEDIQILLDACGYSASIGLKSLQDKALITISDGKVFMHDLIREMGLEIVCEKSLEDLGKQSRLWDANDICQVLKDVKGSEAIKGISLDMSKTEKLYLSPQVFAKMHKLKFLEFYDSSSKGHSLYLPQGLESLPNELKYFRWDNYPLKSLPLTFSAEKLVRLKMSMSRVQKLWNGVQNMVNLKEINLANSVHLMELPDLSKASHLEKACLSNCGRLGEVHPSILSSHKLEVLVLDYCDALTNLKSDIHLRSLRRLSLYHCSRLKEFSVTSENMISLDLRETAIGDLSSSIERLFKLEKFYLSGCKSLKNLPSDSFVGLRSLTELWLDDCRNIFELPYNIDRLSSLRNLSIEGTEVEKLPARIKHLSSLTYLRLNKCTRIRSLPEIPPSIEDLYAMDCSSLETVQFTPTIAEPFKVSMKFRNCLKLNEHSVKAILANLMANISKSVSEVENYRAGYNRTELIYPASRVPEWFKYRTAHASITIDLSSAPLSLDWGLIFCFVAPQSLSKTTFTNCEGYLRIVNDQRVDKGSDYANDHNEQDFKFEEYFSLGRMPTGNLISDHVFLWYNGEFCSEMHQRLKENSAIFNPNIASSLKISLQMNVCSKRIKECGICPTYALEYQNFIKEMEMESQASQSRMGAECSYQNKDEEETLPRKQKSKDFMFPPLPISTTRKIGTQGLKDIIFL